MDVRIVNRDQTASLCFLCKLFWQATSVRNFRTFTESTTVSLFIGQA